MRTETIVCTDDITGETGAETVTFVHDGMAYKIDLAATNRSKLTAALAPFISNATRIGKYGVTPIVAKPSAAVRQQNWGRNDPAYVARIKAWAAENGFHTPARGRIPKTVVTAYREAGGQ